MRRAFEPICRPHFKRLASGSHAPAADLNPMHQALRRQRSDRTVRRVRAHASGDRTLGRHGGRRAQGDHGGATGPPCGAGAWAVISDSLPALIWAAMALVLAGGAAISARRRAQETNARGPGLLLSLVLWAGIFALAFLVAQGADFWTRLASLFR